MTEPNKLARTLHENYLRPPHEAGLAERIMDELDELDLLNLQAVKTRGELRSKVADIIAKYLPQSQWQPSIDVVFDIHNDNELNDGGFFEAGFITAKTKILDALMEKRDAAQPVAGEGGARCTYCLRGSKPWQKNGIWLHEGGVACAEAVFELARSLPATDDEPHSLEMR